MNVADNLKTEYKMGRIFLSKCRLFVSSSLILLSWLTGNPLFASQADTPTVKSPDTVVLSPSQVISVSLSCPVISGYGSGDDELIAINSESDATSAFGYNCSIPDSDYTNHTLLCCSILCMGAIKWQVKTAGENTILSVSGTEGPRPKVLRLLIPRMPPEGNIHLDLNMKPASGR